MIPIFGEGGTEMDKKLDVGNTGTMEIKALKNGGATKKPVKKTGDDLRK